jgi:hypothetical protein
LIIGFLYPSLLGSGTEIMNRVSEPIRVWGSHPISRSIDRSIGFANIRCGKYVSRDFFMAEAYRIGDLRPVDPFSGDLRRKTSGHQ